MNSELTRTPLVQFGNHKLPRYCAILNTTPAGTRCPANKLGLCKHADICYAARAEKRYKQVLPYRLRQRTWWSQTNPEDIVKQMLKWIRRSTTHFRFAEAGDFEGQWSVDKMTYLCAALTKKGIKCYGYTARRSLNFTELKKVATVNGQGFMVSNKIIVGEPRSNSKYVCCGDCHKCNFCTLGKGRVIYIRPH